jgi:hypothetical protein
MSAASRTIQEAPGMRQLGAAIGAIILATTLLLALALGPLTAGQVKTAPAAGVAPVVHDHGWSSDSKPAPAVRVTDFDKAHAAGAGAAARARNGGTLYTGIPYTPSRSNGTGGSNGTRFAR